jgi:hypothetical protein
VLQKVKNDFAGEKSEVKLRNILIIISVLLVIFRLPLFAVLYGMIKKFCLLDDSSLKPVQTILWHFFVNPNDIRIYARYINFVPVVVLMFYTVKEYNKRKLKGSTSSFNSHSVIYFFAISIIIGFCYSIIISLANPDTTLMENIRKFAPYNYFLIFPLLLIYLRFDESDYLYVINRVILPVLLVGGGLLILEYLGRYYSVFDNDYLYAFIGGQYYGLKALNPRPSGILLDSASTSALLIACIAFQYSMLISKNKSSRLIYWFVFSISVGILAVFMAASLYPLMIMIFIIVVIHIIIYRYSFLSVLLSVIIIVLIISAYRYCLAEFALTNLFHHYAYYFSNIKVFTKLFAPQLITNFPFVSFPESHLLDYVRGYELLICLPWLIYVYSPIVKIARIFRIERAKIPSLMLCMVFIMTTAHYSGLEKWGCNYLYSLAVLSLFVKSTLSPESKCISDSPEHTPPCV